MYFSQYKRIINQGLEVNKDYTGRIGCEYLGTIYIIQIVSSSENQRNGKWGTFKMKYLVGF